MEKFKKHWEIQHNWQLLFPIVALLVIAYSAFRFAIFITNNYHIILTLVLTIILSVLITHFFLFIFKKLEQKWVVTYKWEMIRVFMVFAITGSSSVFVGKPIMKFIGITEDNLSPIMYWVLYIVIGLIFYQILLVFFGWLFGQFKFFWEFEKKMLSRFGMGKFFK